MDLLLVKVAEEHHIDAGVVEKRVKNEQSECFQKNATLMLAASIFAKMQQDTYAEPA